MNSPLPIRSPVRTDFPENVIGPMWNNPFLAQVWRTLPRIHALFDVDESSPTFGVGDRHYWAWKLIDFGNGTFQGAAHGLARLLKHQLLPEWLTEEAVLARIGAMFQGADWLQRRNGSLEEAYPFESSFCVTALVAFDLLTAIQLIGDRVPSHRRKCWLEIIRPMIRFLHQAEETHAFISNHLATAAAALYKWHALTGDCSEARGRELLNRILDQQSEEGWFREYEGADPGYQSLCTYYLADLAALRPDLELSQPLRRSLQFLWWFAHPDGSFGGIYGSRNTRFYYPGGVEALSPAISEAASLAQQMRESIAAQKTVGLEAMDEPNLIPMFNSYCWAAALAAEQTERQRHDAGLVPARAGFSRREFRQAGLIVDVGPDHYTVISVHKGGVCYHFKKGQQAMRIDAGVILRRSSGDLFSTQAYDAANSYTLEVDHVRIMAHLVAMRRELPTPFRFVVLRLMALTIMRAGIVNRWIKKLLVNLLITRKSKAPVVNFRSIRLGPELKIVDRQSGALSNYSSVAAKQPFCAIHMASQGYWQRQDEVV